MDSKTKIGLRWNPHSFGIKVILIFIMLLCFQLPIQMIRSTVEERQWRRTEVENEIISSQGGTVSLGGPIMSVPREWEETVQSYDEKITRTEIHREIIYILPDSLELRAVANSKIKSRGIYSVPVYDLLLDGHGVFTPGKTLAQYNPEEICWNQITIQFSYPFLKGMKTIKPFLWNGEELSFQPGGSGDSVYQGIMAVPVSLRDGNEMQYPFQFNQEIQGGDSVQFLPLAEETTITMESDWTAPSFNGYYLPNQSEINETGFSAEWQINYLSRSIPQSWTSSNREIFERIRETAFGVRFFPVVTSYGKTERTLKYGLLFLILPFLTFFLFEIIRKHRIHPIQYLLAGSGNLLFYMLLLSLSEHIPFGGAYLAASTAVTAMLTIYTISVLKARRSGLVMLPVMGASYGYLYFVLQSEDYALLMGSLGLFAIVSLVMFLTRKVKWYGKERTADERV